jgi:hypothetical protein
MSEIPAARAVHLQDLIACGVHQRRLEACPLPADTALQLASSRTRKRTLLILSCSHLGLENECTHPSGPHHCTLVRLPTNIQEDRANGKGALKPTATVRVTNPTRTASM